MPQSVALAAFNPTAEELAEKRRRVAALLDAEGLDALLLTQEGSVAWVTGGGATRVSMNGADAGASILVTKDGTVYALTDAIEAPRIAAEELPEQGVHMKVYPWEQDRATIAPRSSRRSSAMARSARTRPSRGSRPSACCTMRWCGCGPA